MALVPNCLGIYRGIFTYLYEQEKTVIFSKIVRIFFKKSLVLVSFKGADGGGVQYILYVKIWGAFWNILLKDVAVALK